MSNVAIVTVSVSHETKLKLELLCDSLGISRSSYVRPLIEAALDASITKNTVVENNACE